MRHFRSIETLRHCWSGGCIRILVGNLKVCKSRKSTSCLFSDIENFHESCDCRPFCYKPAWSNARWLRSIRATPLFLAFSVVYLPTSCCSNMLATRELLLRRLCKMMKAKNKGTALSLGLATMRATCSTSVLRSKGYLEQQSSSIPREALLLYCVKASTSAP